MKTARKFAVLAARSIVVDAMLWLAPVLVAALTLPPATAAHAAGCSRDQLAAAVDRAGDQLRHLTATTEPDLDAHMQRLQKARGWTDAEVQEKGFGALADDRTAALDATANELLAKIDQLGGDDGTNTAPDCARIAEVEAASQELQATIKAKGQYVIARLDQLLAQTEPQSSANQSPAKDAVVQAAPAPAAQTPAQNAAPTPPAPKSVPQKTAQQQPPSAAPQAAAPTAPPAAKPVVPPATNPRWATQTQTTAPPPPVPAAPPPAPSQMASQSAPPPSSSPPSAPPSASAEQLGEGFTIDEIVEASRGPFGKVSANLARVLEHAFATFGRPTAYVLGQETGGAFVAGLRYGEGTLYMRDGRSLPVFWHGPSVGADVGAQGSATLFLVYKIRQPVDVFSSFTGIEGSAYVVGGIGLTLVSNGHVNMTPIRSGVGLRLGANVGYLRFTPKPTWNPF